MYYNLNKNIKRKTNDLKLPLLFIIAMLDPNKNPLQRLKGMYFAFYSPILGGWSY